MRKVILSYGRTPLHSLVFIRDRFHDLGIAITAIASYKGERATVKEVCPQAKHYCWDDHDPKSMWGAHFDIALYEQLLAPLKSSVLPLSERYGPFEGGSIEAETRAAHAFSRAQAMLNENSPDLIAFAKEPESDFENMLYILARHEGVATVMTRFGAFAHSRTVSTRLEDPLLDEDWNPSRSVIPVCSHGAQKAELDPITSAEINRIRSIGKEYRPAAEAPRLDGRRWMDTASAVVRYASDLRRFRQVAEIGAHGPLFKRWLYNSYSSVTSAVPVSSDGPMIFFPLHYQPELTTMPRGGMFVNQIKVAKLLSDALPPTGKILVKEHPAIFSNNTRTNRNFRPRNYYQWLARIPKVTLVAMEMLSGELQEKCDVTACVTGTAGLESMVRGKATLVFGDATYLNGPNVFKVKTTSEVAAVLDSLSERAGEPDQRGDVETFLARIGSLCFHRSEALPISPRARAKAFQEHLAMVLVEGVQKYLARSE